MGDKYVNKWSNLTVNYNSNMNIEEGINHYTGNNVKLHRGEENPVKILNNDNHSVVERRKTTLIRKKTVLTEMQKESYLLRKWWYN